MITIPISPVTLGEFAVELAARESVAALLDRPVEAWGIVPGRLVRCDIRNAFAVAAHDAFYDHHPLLIRPDDVWFCVAQGFAIHVREIAEALRARFVEHAGKRKLRVPREDFRLGQPNPWLEVFAAFSEQIGAQVGPVRVRIAARFSTPSICMARRSTSR